MKNNLILFSLLTIGLAACSSPASSSHATGLSSSSASSETSMTASSETSVTTATSDESSISETSSEPVAYDVEALKEEYGEFSISGGEYSYDPESATYTINVAETKIEYSLTGFFSGKILIVVPESMESYKGVKLSLEGACLVGEGEEPVIQYDPTEKNVQISAKKGTENYILALGEGEAIHSSNNIEFSGKGDLEMCSSGGDSHVLYADKKITVTGSPAITITKSAHDAFHGNSFYSSDDEGVPFEGLITIRNCLSQAFDFETKKGKGTIELDGGTIFVDGAVSVFKTDVSLTIAESVAIIATNITGDPVVQGDNSTGLTVTNNGTFTVNGKDYQ